uniref:MICOS complex subunit Mic19 n=1 Tax=Schistocephalus solidus TaxID=70667 RepID=A0A0V0J9T4_SCHSO
MIPVFSLSDSMGSVFGTQPVHNVHFSRSDILISDDVLQRVMHHQNSTTPVVSKPMVVPAPPIPEQPPQPAEDSSSAVRLSHSLDDIERRFEARLKKIEERDDSFLKAAEDEFVRVVDRLEAKYLKGSSEACCVAAQKQVVDCYKANGQQSLNCAKEVNEFVSCVANFRAARMTRAQPAAI